VCAVIALILLGVPLLEIYVLIQVGGEIGALTTIGVLVGIGVIGAFLSRRAGVQTLRDLAESAAAGRSMAPVMAEGALVALAGMLFMVPGFVTDVAALVLLVPPVRRRLARRLVLRAAGTTTQSTTVIIDTTGVERPDHLAVLPARVDDLDREDDEDQDQDEDDQDEERPDPRADDDDER
jgi:UPF0716 protein FxsA